MHAVPVLVRVVLTYMGRGSAPRCRLAGVQPLRPPPRRQRPPAPLPHPHLASPVDTAARQTCVPFLAPLAVPTRHRERHCAMATARYWRRGIWTLVASATLPLRLLLPVGPPSGCACVTRASLALCATNAQRALWGPSPTAALWELRVTPRVLTQAGREGRGPTVPTPPRLEHLPARLMSREPHSPLAPIHPLTMEGEARVHHDGRFPSCPSSSRT
jgi:hypothetical protein